MGVRGYFLDFYSFRNSKFPVLLRVSKATEAISRNFKFILRNSSFLLRIRWLGVRGYFLDFYSFRNSSLGILEFPASLRGSKATEAISRNSKFCLVILDFCSLLGWTSLARKFYKGYAQTLRGCCP